MFRWFPAVLICTQLGCTATDDDGSSSGAVREEGGQSGIPRVVFGRVHDAADHNVGLPGLTVEGHGGETVTDGTGGYRLEGRTPMPWIRVKGTAEGWSPYVVHLPEDGDTLEIWPGMVPLEEANQAIAIMAGTSDTPSSLQDDLVYLVVQVRLIGSLISIPDGAEVEVLVDGERAPDQFVFSFNEAVGGCLPVRVDEGPVVTDLACDGIALVPGLDPGAEITVEAFHPLRECARSSEQRLEGDVASSLSWTLDGQPGALNVTGVECGDVL